MILKQISFAVTVVFGCQFLQKILNRNKKKVYKPTYTLLGDVGGTNIRLQLVLIQPPSDEPLQIVKADKLKVKQHDNFELALKSFLIGVPLQKYPEIASIGIAGAVKDNKVSLANVTKWGQLNGNKIGSNLSLKSFSFLNDFTANSFGLLLMKDDNFISLNGFEIDPTHTRGVLGPGTGLGNSIIYSAPFRKRERIYVLPSEGGHRDYPYVDEQSLQYYNFFREKIDAFYICLEKSFCGPSLPYMFQYFASKFPHFDDSHIVPTSEEIIKRYLINPKENNLYKKTIELFIKLYSNAIANFLATHMCSGGIYLVGSLTNSLTDILKERNILEEYSQRHPEMYEAIKDFPIVVSKQIDLGLKGAYVYARRIIADQQHDE